MAITKEQAAAALSEPLVCENYNEWTPIKILVGTHIIENGLLTLDGQKTQLQVKLMYKHSHKTKDITYQFSIFKRYPYGMERVYQLEVYQTKFAIKDPHKFSHEHMGGSRTEGEKFWESWDFYDVLRYFCSRTLVSFDPELPHPEDFKLRG